MSTPLLQAYVHQMRVEANGIISLELRPTPGSTPAFPGFEAGAHIDLHLPNGLVRSYSLVNPGSHPAGYVIGVLKDRNSRGGSRHVHESLRIGQTLPISAPRNHFKLAQDTAPSVLLAGGIGITPIYAMLQALCAQGRPVHLVYCARSRAEAAWLPEVTALVAAAVAQGQTASLTLHFDDEQAGPPELKHLLAQQSAQAHFYACGPGPMLDAFEQTCASLGYANVHLERFAAKPTPVSTPQGGYVVELRQSGRTVAVPAGANLLDTLLDAGLNPAFSCHEGLCGACETKVLEGEVEHRDLILTPQEQAANNTMMICVSGCRSQRLVLDL